MRKTKVTKRPAYTLHKPSGQGRVRLDGRDHYLGEYNTPDSITLYNEMVNEWLAKKPVDKFTMTVAVLCVRYMKHVDAYYRKDGKPTSEPNNIRIALRYLIAKKGTTVARAFGPLALQEVRSAMIKAGCVRTSINRMIGRVKRAFRWGVSQEYFPAEMLLGLDSVDGLLEDRSEAEESEPVCSVETNHVDAIKPFVTRQVWGMIQLQLLSAARPGEIRTMRTCDITRDGKVWEYRPQSHKMQHKKRERLIFLGPNAQTVLKDFLKLDRPDDYIFSPAEARAEYFAKRRENRKTPMTPSQRKRQRLTNPSKKPGTHYTDKSYGRAIAVACEKAGIEPWHPHQLRHTKATEIRSKFDLEAAQVVLGQKHASTTEIYAERDKNKARKVIRKVG